MDYLGRKSVGLIGNQVYGSTIWMLPRDGEEELMHATIKNSGHGAGDS